MFGRQQFPAQAERRSVEPQCGSRILLLRLDGVGAEPGWLGQVGAVAAEAEGFPVDGPGQRYATSVSAFLGPARSPEYRVL